MSDAGDPTGVSHGVVVRGRCPVLPYLSIEVRRETDCRERVTVSVNVQRRAVDDAAGTWAGEAVHVGG